MSTYSINIGTPYESTFNGNLDRDFILNTIPNNTSQLVVPKSVRDSLFTVWDNISFKIVAATGSSFSYIGVGGQNHKSYYGNGNDGLSVLLGKPSYSGSDIMNNYLLEYDENNSLHSNSDLYVYNSKPDDFDDGSAHKQYTKMSFLSGDNSNNLFRQAPYILSQQNVGGTAIDMTIYNEGGKVIIDSNEELQIGSPNTKITLLYATGSTGIQTLPSGDPGDIQTNLDDCDFGHISGTSANLGDVLIMGASNSPYWGNIALNFIGTLNQTLGSGNTTDGEDIIVTENDTLYIGGTSTNHSYITHNSTYTNLKTDNGELRIGANTFRLDVNGVGPNKTLYTDSNGFAFWGTSFTNTGSFKPMSSNLITSDVNLSSLNAGHFYNIDSSSGNIKINLDVTSISAGQEWEFFVKNLDNTVYFDSNDNIISEDNYVAFSKKGSFIKVRRIDTDEYGIFGSGLDILSISTNDSISVSGENDMSIVFTGNTGETATITVNSIDFVIGDIGGQFVFDIGGSQVYTYSTVNETNQFVANGTYFDITWGGTGSQYFNYNKKERPSLTMFNSSSRVQGQIPCGEIINREFYHDGSSSYPIVGDFVYLNENYEMLGDGFYNMVNDTYIEINNIGRVKSINQCYNTSFTLYHPDENDFTIAYNDTESACTGGSGSQTLMYHNGSGEYPQNGDKIVIDNTTNDPLELNNGQYFKYYDSGQDTYYTFTLINTNEVSDITECSGSLTSFTLYKFEAEGNAGFSDTNQACQEEGFTQTVYHNGLSQYPQIGDDIYEDSNGVNNFIPDGDNIFKYNDIDNDYTFTINEDGIVVDEPLQCGGGSGD